MISTQDFEPGLTIELDGNVYQIIEREHHKPGKGQAVVRTKLRDIETEKVFNKTFRSGDKVEQAHVERDRYQYLYSDGLSFYFMHTDTYEQIKLNEEQVGENAKWLKEGEDVTLVTYEDRVIDLDVGQVVVREVTKCDPGVRGDTATGGTKPASIEGGATVSVPLFVNIGDGIKVDTRTGEYVERA